MATLPEIRQKNLQLLANQYQYVTQFSLLTGVGNNQMDQLLKKREPPRNLGEKLARRIEGNLGLPPGWLDSPHDSLGDLQLPPPGSPVRYPVRSIAPHAPNSLTEAHARENEMAGAPLSGPSRLSPNPTESGQTMNDVEPVTDKDNISLAGLNLLQKAVVEVLVKLARVQALSDRECVELLESWKNRMA